MNYRVRPGSAGLALAAAAALAASVLAAAAPPASAAPASRSAASHRARPLRSGSGAGQNLSSTVAPSWQTNGTVWALAVARGHVYVGGQFTTVRPPGHAPGSGQVARSFLAEFSARTGALMAFHPTLDGEVRALAVAPNGKTLYVGGGFTHVTTRATGMVFRERLAAFSTVTGALSGTWKPTANSKVMSIAPAPGGSSIYLGGGFTSLDSQSRTFAGAVAGTGSLLAWAPQLSGALTSVAVAPDGKRVLVGGYFTAINGVTQQAIGSTDPVLGHSEPWAATIVPRRNGCSSAVKDIIVRGTIAYIADEGTGPGCFDGDWAARISNGTLLWQNDCLGATQALAIVNGWLYKGSHAHDCSYTPGGFPQVASPSGKSNITHRLLDQSLGGGALGHWNPNTNGNNLGPRVMATDGRQLFLGGDFTTVNNLAQQGFARFEPGPDTTTPVRPAAPGVASTSAGVVSVAFSAVSDPDDGTLTYAIYRDGGRKPIARLKATSWPWALPVLHYRDAGRARGSRHTYRVTASDGTRTSAKSPASASVKVAARNPPRSYVKTVLRDGPSFFWPLSEKSGSTAGDGSGHSFNGIYEAGTAKGVAGPVKGTRATAFSGRKSGLVTAASAVSAPQGYSIEGWFRTTTNRGGKLIGFGSSQTGSSVTFDRQIYLQNDGQLVFGVFDTKIEAIITRNVYNDGQWHFVVASLSPAGMTLRVDDQLVGENSATTSDESYSGYWRVGGDNLAGGWNLDPLHGNSQGSTEPNRYYVTGDIGDVAVFPQALSAAQIAAQYAANALSH
jgi:Concanavalin A-like lectin/glucanases superfamily